MSAADGFLLIAAIYLVLVLSYEALVVSCCANPNNNN